MKEVEALILEFKRSIQPLCEAFGIIATLRQKLVRLRKKGGGREFEQSSEFNALCRYGEFEEFRRLFAYFWPCDLIKLEEELSGYEKIVFADFWKD